MLPLLLLFYVAASIGAPTDQCDLSKVGIKGGIVSDKGGVVTFQCPAGKYPSPVSEPECVSGSWTRESKEAKCLDVECPPLWGGFENGRYSPVQRNYVVNSTLRFQCYDGFKLHGSETRTCLENGKWSGKTAICDNQVAHCSNPGIPIGASKMGIDYQVGEKVIYTCQRGLKMFGSGVRICQENTKWSGSEPICRQTYTYDTPKEVAAEFGSSISTIFESSDPDRVEEKGDRKIKVKEGGLMNIFVLLDASSSVGEMAFALAKEITDTFIQMVSRYDFVPRYSILTFASEVKTIVKLDEEDINTDPEQVLEKVQEFEYTAHKRKHGTNTRAALSTVLNQLALFKQHHMNIFYETSNVILILTDGKHNMGGNPSTEVKRIKEFLNIGTDGSRDDKLDIYVFGLTEKVKEEELNEIASQKDSERHVFKMPDLINLQDAFNSMIDEAEAFEMCGISKNSFSDHERYPWIVDVTVTREQTEYCKGSIISKNFILSAAHCFLFDDDPEKIAVNIGGDLFNAKNFHMHPGYAPDSKTHLNIPKFFAYDFALVELDKPLVYSSKVRPICLPCTKGASWALKLRGKKATCQDHKTTLLPRDVVEALFVSMSSDEKKYLRQDVDIKLGEKKQACLEDAKHTPVLAKVENIQEAVTEDFFCTGDTIEREEPQTCKGDSGGPLIIERKKRFFQVGVVSWGTILSCDRFDRLNVPLHSRDFHTDIFKAIDWIKEKLGKDIE